MNKETNESISKRHNTRCLTIAIMYDLDLNMSLNNYNEELNQNLINQVIDDVLEMNKLSLEDEEVNLIDYYDEKFLKEIINGLYTKLSIIDELIEKNLVKWTIDRLSYVDRAIIRLATFEMLTNQISKSVIINEALELTKELSNIEENEQVKFNNRLLDNVAKMVYGE